MNGYFTSWVKGNVWEYNFQSVLSACSLLYGFLFGAPAAIWFVFKQYEPKLKFVTVFCLYGYSMFTFGPALVRINVMAKYFLSLISLSVSSLRLLLVGFPCSLQLSSQRSFFCEIWLRL